MSILKICSFVVAWLALAAPAWALAFEEGFAPSQDLTVWPLQVTHGYPLVRGEVGGVKGVFMLDTGTPFGLLLNRARINLPDATYVVSGAAGSGQKIDIFRSAAIPAVGIHGQSWPQVRQVFSADLGFIEQGTGMGPYLGFIGANFFKDTALTLDYARRVAAVQRLHPETGAPRAALPADRTGGTVVATVRYQAERANFPAFEASLSGVPVRVMLDSGNSGASIDRQWAAELQRTGAIQPFSVYDNTPTYRLAPLLLGSVSVPVEDVSTGEPEAVIDGPTARPLVKIGYSLLKRLGVTWNYRLQTMTFFTP